MKHRIFRSMCLLSVIVVVLTAFLVTALRYSDFLSSMKSMVQLETEYIRAGVAVNELINFFVDVVGLGFDNDGASANLCNFFSFDFNNAAVQCYAITGRKRKSFQNVIICNERK